MISVSGCRQWTDSGVIGRPTPVPVIALKPFDHCFSQNATSTTRPETRATINLALNSLHHEDTENTEVHGDPSNCGFRIVMIEAFEESQIRNPQSPIHN